MTQRTIADFLNGEKQWYRTNRIPLILFSGGYDSTLLLLQTLEYTNVDVLYVKGWQNELKTHLELAARQKIIKKINDSKRDFYIKTDYVVDCILPNSLVSRSGSYYNGLQQPLEWLTAALLAYAPRNHWGLLYGAIAGDDITGHQVDAKRAWESLIAIKYRNEPSILDMPLSNTTKLEVYGHLFADYYEFLPLITTCEVPKSTYLSEVLQTEEPSPYALVRECGECLACLKEKKIYQQFYITSKRPERKPYLMLNSTRAKLTLNWSGRNTEKIDKNVLSNASERSWSEIDTSSSLDGY